MLHKKFGSDLKALMLHQFANHPLTLYIPERVPRKYVKGKLHDVALKDLHFVENK